MGQAQEGKAWCDTFEGNDIKKCKLSAKYLTKKVGICDRIDELSRTINKAGMLTVKRAKLFPKFEVDFRKETNEEKIKDLQEKLAEALQKTDFSQLAETGGRRLATTRQVAAPLERLAD